MICHAGLLPAEKLAELRYFQAENYAGRLPAELAHFRRITGRRGIFYTNCRSSNYYYRIIMLTNRLNSRKLNIGDIFRGLHGFICDRRAKVLEINGLRAKVQWIDQLNSGIEWRDKSQLEKITEEDGEVEDERQEEVQEVSSSTVVVGGGIAVEEHNEDDNLVNCSSIEMGEELLVLSG